MSLGSAMERLREQMDTDGKQALLTRSPGRRTAGSLRELRAALQTPTVPRRACRAWSRESDPPSDTREQGSLTKAREASVSDAMDLPDLPPRVLKRLQQGKECATSLKTRKFCALHKWSHYDIVSNKKNTALIR